MAINPARSRENGHVTVDVDLRNLLESLTAQISLPLALQEWVDNALDAAHNPDGTSQSVSVVITIDRKNNRLGVINYGGEAMNQEQMAGFLQLASRSKRSPHTFGQHHLGGTAALLAACHRTNGGLYIEAADAGSSHVRSTLVPNWWNQLEVGRSFPIDTHIDTPQAHSHTSFYVEGLNLDFFDQGELAKAIDQLGHTYAQALQTGQLSVRIIDIPRKGQDRTYHAKASQIHTKQTLYPATTYDLDGFPTTVSVLLQDQEATKDQAQARADEYGHHSPGTFRHYTSALIYFQGRLSAVIPLKDLPIGITRKGTLDSLLVVVTLEVNPDRILQRDILKTGLSATDGVSTQLRQLITNITKPIVAELLREEKRDDVLTEKHSTNLEKTLDAAYTALCRALGQNQAEINALLGVEPKLRIETLGSRQASAAQSVTQASQRRELVGKLAGIKTGRHNPRTISLDDDGSGHTLTVSELETEGLPPMRIAHLGKSTASVVIDRQHQATIQTKSYIDTIYSYAILLNADCSIINTILEGFGSNPSIKLMRRWLIQLVLDQLLTEAHLIRHNQMGQEDRRQIQTLVSEIIALVD